jgi:putative protein RhsD
LYQGQYYDVETKLAYNRFRYYSPETGAYISQDPIGLSGNNPNLYAYVEDSNWWVDVFGLFKVVKKRVLSDGRIREYSKEVPSTTPGPTRGASMVKETSPTGNTRMWMESYGHNGEVVRVDPKAIDGKPVDLPHYPPTYKDIQEGKAIETSNGKGKKVQCQKK